jgi:DNA-binding beta-propeller fold protein YncE
MVRTQEPILPEGPTEPPAPLLRSIDIRIWEDKMTLTTRTMLGAAALLAFGFAGSAGAAELKMIASIPVPGAPLTSFDISFVDQKTQRYYLADRSNKAVDIVDAKDNKWIGRATGFVGAVMKPDGKSVNSNKSGPDGVLAVGNEIWAGDGDSTIKVIDAKTMKITDTIKTGGSTRLDEMAYDPKNMIFIGANNAEEPPFATIIDMHAGHKIIAKIPFPDATDGAEQPDWNAADGMFYLAVPELKKDPKKGGVAVIEPKTGKLVKMIEVDNCRPNGLAFGPDQNFVLGCQANGKKGLAPVITIMNAKTGKVVANVADIGGADMVAYSKKNNQYYTGTSNMEGGAVLGVIDAKTNKLVQKIPMKGASTPHSVAVNDNNGHVFVPGGGGDGGCSCIQVFALQ